MIDTPKYLVDVPECEKLNLMDLFARFLHQIERIEIGNKSYLRFPDVAIDIAKIEFITTREALPDNKGALFQLDMERLTYQFYLERVDKNGEIPKERFENWYKEIEMLLNSGSDEFIEYEGVLVNKNDIRLIVPYSDGSTRLFFRSGAAAIRGTIN